MLVTSIFSLNRNVFCPIKEKVHNLSSNEIVVCKCFQFEKFSFKFKTNIFFAQTITDKYGSILLSNIHLLLFSLKWIHLLPESINDDWEQDFDVEITPEDLAAASELAQKMNMTASDYNTITGGEVSNVVLQC